MKCKLVYLSALAVFIGGEFNAVLEIASEQSQSKAPAQAKERIAES
jgi:uncharacterized BrkB/YihY/UPF0761 family membrane protein